MSKAEGDVVLELPADTPADEELQTEAETPGQDDSQADVEDEVTVTIGEGSPPSEEDETASAPEWVRELRKSNREKDRRIRELEQGQAAAPATAVVVGPKPKLEDLEYDTERFERELEAWHERKRTADSEQAKNREAAEAGERAWAARLANHSKLKSELKVKDFDDAEAVVEAATTVTQRGLIVHGADNSALVFYALAKNPSKLKEISSITDPVKFAFAVAKLETQLKVSPRRAAPVPERTVRGNASTTGSVDNQLEKLRAEAVKTGDLSKVIAYKNSKRAERK